MNPIEEQEALDRVFIRSLCVHTCIGCTPEERDLPQRLLFSLEIFLSKLPNEGNIRLEDSVCYAQSAECIQEVARKTQWVLVEELARACMKALFDRFPVAVAIEIAIDKFAVPHTDACGVRMYRRRAELISD